MFDRLFSGRFAKQLFDGSAGPNSTAEPPRFDPLEPRQLFAVDVLLAFDPGPNPPSNFTFADRLAEVTAAPGVNNFVYFEMKASRLRRGVV